MMRRLKSQLRARIKPRARYCSAIVLDQTAMYPLSFVLDLDTKSVREYASGWCSFIYSRMPVYIILSFSSVSYVS